MILDEKKDNAVNDRVKTSLFEGILVEDKGANCTSFKIVCAKNILSDFFERDLLEYKHQ